MNLDEFIFQYFINPIYTGEGYNIYNTTVYAIILILALYLGKFALKRMRVKIDEKFFWMLVPYILLGGMVRALADLAFSLGFQKNFWLITPGIYISMLALTIITMLVSKFSRDWKNTSQRIGWIYVVIGFIGISFYMKNFGYLLAILFLAGIASIPLLFLLKKWNIYSKENLLLVWGHTLDGSASSIAVAFLGYGEQHIIPTMIMQKNPFFFLLFKMVIVLAVIYAIEKYSEDKEWLWLLKFAVLMLGLAPGTRDALRVFMEFGS